RLRGPQRRFRLFGFLTADGAGREELGGALRLLSRECNGGLARGQFGFLTGDGRLLAPRIDLHQRSTLADAVARLDEDRGDLTLDLRLNGGGAQRLDGSDVFGRVIDRYRVRCDERDWRRRHLGRTRLLPLTTMA